MPIHMGKPTGAIDPKARKLYLAIRDTIDGLDFSAKLKFVSAFNTRPDWEDLDPVLQRVFSDVAIKLRPY